MNQKATMVAISGTSRERAVMPFENCGEDASHSLLTSIYHVRSGLAMRRTLIILTKCIPHTPTVMKQMAADVRSR